jgi:hypothetical protein
MEPAANYIWGATFIFSHWDADTLCGRLEGTVRALNRMAYPSLWARPWM